MEDDYGAQQQAAEEFVRQFKIAFDGNSFASIARKTHIPEATLRRYARGLLPRDTRHQSVSNMRVLSESIPEAETIWAAFRAKERQSSAEVTTSTYFYGIIERDSDHSSVSVDLIKASIGPSGVTGTITRAIPKTEGSSPHSWDFRGYNDGARAFYLAFRSSDPNSASTGSIVARRATLDSADYVGFYEQYDDEYANSVTLIRRPYNLVKSLPQHLRPDVALIGLSYTLLSEDVLEVWTQSLSKARIWKDDSRLREFRQVISEEPEAWRSFDTDGRRRITLALARFVEGREEQLADMAERWFLRKLRNYEYPWVRPFLGQLESLGIAPIAVTGLPEFLARPLCASFGIDELYSLTFDGSTVLSDPGDEEGRNNVVDFVLGHGRNDLVSLTSEEGDPLGDALVNLRAGRGNPDNNNALPGWFNCESDSSEVTKFMKTMLPVSGYPRLA